MHRGDTKVQERCFYTIAQNDAEVVTRMHVRDIHSHSHSLEGMYKLQHGGC